MNLIKVLLNIYFQICIILIKIILNFPILLLFAIWCALFSLYSIPRIVIYLPFQLIDKIFGLNKDILYEQTNLDLKIERILDPLANGQLINKFDSLIQDLDKIDSFREIKDVFDV